MRKIVKFKLTEEEKKAVKNCVETINCDGFDCGNCPFNYSEGCMLEVLQEVVVEEEEED